MLYHKLLRFYFLTVLQRYKIRATCPIRCLDFQIADGGTPQYLAQNDLSRRAFDFYRHIRCFGELIGQSCLIVAWIRCEEKAFFADVYAIGQIAIDGFTVIFCYFF